MDYVISTTKAVLLYNSDSGKVRCLHRDAGLYYGITWTPEFLLCASRPGLMDINGATIHVFNRQLEHVKDVFLPQVVDLHQIYCHQNELWVASSGHDCFWVYEVNDFSPKYQFCPVLSATLGVADSHHFNSVLISDGRIYTLAHNRHAGSFVCVHDYQTRDFIERHEGLGFQSHNLWPTQDKGLVVLNSGESALNSLLQGNFLSLSDWGSVFPRGLAVTHGAVAIGLSPFEADAEKRVNGMSKIAVAKADLSNLHIVELGAFGSVYEVRAIGELDQCHPSSVFSPTL